MGATPSVPRDRTRKMQVIGAGYSRTGTSTFALAMEILLNGPVHHGGSQFVGAPDCGFSFLPTSLETIPDDLTTNPPVAHVKLMYELFRYRNDRPHCLKVLGELTAGFVSISDSPGASFVGELCELYSEAVVICVTRDKTKWWKSLEPITTNASTWWLELLLWPCPGWRWFAPCMTMFGERNVELYGMSFCEELYDRHIEYVKRVVPKDRLHFVDLKQGWEPFCEILGKPIPQVPFPHVNDAVAADQIFKGIALKAAGLWMLIISLIGWIAYIGLRTSRWTK